MNDNSKTKKLSFNKKTAMIYGGAAILILVVGIRSIFLTSDELGFLSYFTIGAIVLETILLIIYAKAIYQDNDEEDTTSGDGDTYSFNLDMSSMEDKMEQLNIAYQKPEKAKELEQILDNYLIEVHAPKWQEGITWKNTPLKEINSNY